MKIYRLVDVAGIRNKNYIFVPTMGGLHEGHLRLIRLAKKRGRVLVSLFINPLQFNEKKDFLAYPRNSQIDIRLLRKAGVREVFLPRPGEIFRRTPTFKVSLPPAGKVLCGNYRPGHFQGVLSVILSLLHMLSPRELVLGEKDYQQYWLVREFLREFHSPVRVILNRTVRDRNFIPYSTRYGILNQRERDISIAAWSVLKRVYKLGARALAAKLRVINRDLKKTGWKTEYMELRNQEDLGPWKGSGRPRFFLAGYIGKVRLIDNWILNE